LPIFSGTLIPEVGQNASRPLSNNLLVLLLIPGKNRDQNLSVLEKVLNVGTLAEEVVNFHPFYGNQLLFDLALPFLLYTLRQGIPDCQILNFQVRALLGLLGNLIQVNHEPPLPELLALDLLRLGIIIHIDVANPP